MGGRLSLTGGSLGQGWRPSPEGGGRPEDRKVAPSLPGRNPRLLLLRLCSHQSPRQPSAPRSDSTHPPAGSSGGGGGSFGPRRLPSARTARTHRGGAGHPGGETPTPARVPRHEAHLTPHPRPPQVELYKGPSPSSRVHAHTLHLEPPAPAPSGCPSPHPRRGCMRIYTPRPYLDLRSPRGTGRSPCPGPGIPLPGPPSPTRSHSPAKTLAHSLPPGPLRRGRRCEQQHPAPRTPLSPRPCPGASPGAGCRHRGWGLRGCRPLPRAGPPRRSRRRGREVAQRTGAGLGFPARAEREEEEEEPRRGGGGRDGLCVCLRPSPGSGAAPPLPPATLPRRGRGRGGGEARERGRRLRDAGSGRLLPACGVPSAPRDVQPRRLWVTGNPGCCNRAKPGPRKLI